MIKLIASDMDGTLLDSKKEISGHIGQIIGELEKRGIHFVAASGRSRSDLLAYFGERAAATVSDNGGTVYAEDGTLLFSGDFSPEAGLPVLKLARETSYMHIVLIGIKELYMQEDEEEEYKQFAQKFFNYRIKFVPDITEAFHMDKIVKISLSTGKDGKNEKRGMALMEQFGDMFSIVLSGDGWVDLLRKDVSKGAALKILCDYYHISMEETIVFGDYLNDLDMLRRTPNSYAMANAHPKVKETCAHITRFTNNEDGVARELDNIFALNYF